MTNIKKLFKFIIVVIAFSVIAYAVVPVYLKSGAEKFAEHISPDGRYRIEFYSPTKIKQFEKVWYGDETFFVKAYDIKNKKYFFTSDITEFMFYNGIGWNINNKILVGEKIEIPMDR